MIWLHVALPHMCMLSCQGVSAIRDLSDKFHLFWRLCLSTYVPGALTCMLCLQAASAASSLSDKAGESTPDVNIPGFGPFKGNPKEDAKQAGKKASELTSSAKSSLGYMHIGELAFDFPSLPGSNVKKTDLPDGPKPLSGTLDIGGGSDVAGQVRVTRSCISTVLFPWCLGLCMGPGLMPAFTQVLTPVDIGQPDTQA